ncbi:MAG: T9SS C-terminal target domain-containing protein [Cytophagales bacterium]|nr:MAG: T9SS C-terminal target domain-containing protein [Cytophagales bacterium]TAF62082.1 MAG: T9SS C-terminal target domain-containing protein [Cytophagales bacterium]
MVKLYLNVLMSVFALIACMQKANAQVTNVNGTINILGGGTVMVCNSFFDNQAAGTVSLTGTLDVNTTLTNNGVFTGNAGSLLLMSGTAEQLVNGAAVVNTFDLQINNGGFGVTNANTGHIRVANNLLLSSGRLFTSNATQVRFTPTALNPAETNANHIVGTAYVEPRAIGAGAFGPFLNMTLAAGGNITSMDMFRRTGNGTGNTLLPAPTSGVVNVGGNTSIAAYWSIQSPDSLLFPNRDMTISWLSAWDNGKNLLQMQRWRSRQYGAITAPWREMNPLSDLSARTLTLNSGIVLVRDWTYSDIVNPLPVNILSFNAQQQNEDAWLTWATSEEKNMSHYEILRSVDGENFATVGRVQALNKVGVASYNFRDLNFVALPVETVYYQLKQVEQDGKHTLSAVRSINLQHTATFAVNAFPNPFADELTINIQNLNSENCQISLTDNLGRVLYTAQTNEKFAQFELNHELSSLSTGSYILSVRASSGEKFIKLIKR